MTIPNGIAASNHSTAVSPEQSTALAALTRARSQPSTAGIAAAEKRVVTAFLSLATALARRYANRGLEAEDLQQLAFLGLVKAVKRWDPTVGAEFVPYAYPVILGEMKRHFRDHLTTIRLPRVLQEVHAQAAAARETFRQRVGRDATDAELAAAVGVDIALIRAEHAATFHCRAASLDEPAVLDQAAHDPCTAAAVELDLIEDRMILTRALAELTERQRRLVGLRYWHGLSQSQIADVIGISQMHVSRQLRAIQTKMRAYVECDRDAEQDRLPVAG
jgi:RNA polymerase sigma-B factor